MLRHGSRRRDMIMRVWCSYLDYEGLERIDFRGHEGCFVFASGMKIDIHIYFVLFRAIIIAALGHLPSNFFLENYDHLSFSLGT
jgi:hypothetical protein